MKKQNSKIMAVACAGALTLVMAGCGSDSGSANQAKSFDSKQVEEIMIKTEGQNIEVRPSGNDEVKVSINADKEVPASLNGNVLTVDLGKSSSLVNFKTATLHVDVPSKTYRKISLLTTSGRISGESLKANELVLFADSGKIEVNGFDGSKISGEMIAGNMDLKKVDGDLSIENDSGNVTITHKGKLENDSSINTNTGKVDLKFDTKPSALQLDVTTESGKIQSSLTTSSDITPKGGGSKLNAKIGSKDGAVPTMTIRSSSGNITLQ